jgi:hypothetical protein
VFHYSTCILCFLLYTISHCFFYTFIRVGSLCVVSSCPHLSILFSNIYNLRSVSQKLDSLSPLQQCHSRCLGLLVMIAYRLPEMMLGDWEGSWFGILIGTVPQFLWRNRAQTRKPEQTSLCSGDTFTFPRYIMFVPHRKHICEPPCPVTGIALLLYM